MGTGYLCEDMFPAEYGKDLTADGAWIIMLLSVRVGRDLGSGEVKQIEVPHLSCWFATPSQSSNSLLSKAVIQTPDGEVCVWPHEYARFDLSKFLEFTSEDGFQIHFMHESSAFNEGALFYLRSRGISKGQAQRMLLADLKDPNYCYFTFGEIAREAFPEGTGVMHLTRENHARRERTRREHVVCKA